ncbi:anti-sigma factor antagonist [Niallia circulans]|uniref:Anti-sigma factor antagonist n=1 Tax=Niallia circulans TaxID=1397 RepID=A0A0J1L1L7_NIACI|nr:STAS domain-containing protein [Niallia circulans]KLV22885.1 anti-sigma factor antagonist [Niallia circulans]
MLTFSLYPIDDYLEVRLEGDLDIDGTEIIEEELIPSLKNHQYIKINFEHVPFVDSSGMGLLMNVVQTLKATSAKVKVINVKGEVMEIFELLQLPDILGESVFE